MWRSSHINGAERRDTHKIREGRRGSNGDSHRDRSQRDKDREHRSRREHSRKNDERHEHERQGGKKKYERSPSRKEDNRSKHREHYDRSRSRDRSDSGRRREDQHRQKRSSEEMRGKKEASPEWGKSNAKNDGKSKPQGEKEKPNFELSGKLTEDMNTVNGVVIKYSEPQDARKPKRRWRLYPFKGEKALPTLYIHRQSAYLMGRDRKVADIPLDHPSCSKQHAALQYRLVSFQKEGGIEGKRIRPYLIDLDSANGTFVNNVKLEPRRYHELLERDVLRFGYSSREYVLLHEHSKDDSLDDDVPFTAAT